MTVLSRHDGDLFSDIRKHKLDGLFTRVIHIGKNNSKADFIDNKKAIFIDDSYAERVVVIKKCRIPSFGLDMIDALCDNWR